MKILGLDEFLKLPNGTLYSEYKPTVCTGLFVKYDTITQPDEDPADFFCVSLIAECVNGEHPTTDNAMSRWAMFDYNAQFAVYESADIKTIRGQLNQ